MASRATDSTSCAQAPIIFEEYSKDCSRCRETKPFSAFHRKRSSSDGRRSACRECRKTESREQYVRHKERIDEWSREYAASDRGREVNRKATKKYREKHRRRILRTSNAKRRANYVPSMLYQARAKAKRRGLECDLDREDIIIPSHCPVFGIPLKMGDGRIEDGSPSLDRIDNTRGYVKGNVVVVSNKVNRIKNDATIEELRRVVEFYESL